MAMVYCRGCGKEIHETAPTCPQCGFVQFTQETNSLWMSMVAFVLAILSFANWFSIENWDHNTKVGLWMFSVGSLALGITSIHQKKRGIVFSGISIAVAAITILILIGKTTR